MTVFEEPYRIVAVDSQCLTIRGVLSGEVLVINADPEIPLIEGDYPVGKLIVLTDPSAAPSPH